MENKSNHLLEIFWEEILSQQPDRIRRAYLSVDLKSRDSVLTHLLKMVNEDGWQPEQRESAKVALQVIRRYFLSNDS